MNNKGADQTAQMGRLVCAFVVRKPPKNAFLKAHIMLVNRAGIRELCVRITEKTLIRLLFQKQSDLDLHYLSRPF